MPPYNSRGQRVATSNKSKMRRQAKALRKTPRKSTGGGSASIGGGTSGGGS